MTIESLQKEDINSLIELQPTDWDDIRPHHSAYIHSGYCHPLKLVLEEKIAAIGTIIYHQDSAWLAHIIVHPACRNRGLGKIITQSLVDRIDRAKYDTISLIATDLGYPVYLKIGFEQEAVYQHFITKTPFSQHIISSSILPFNKEYTEGLLKMDQVISGECRHDKILEHLSGSFIFINENKLEGAYFPTMQNGLIIANNPLAGIELMKQRLQSKNFAILPEMNEPAIQFLRTDQYIKDRISRRMFIGKKRSWQPTAMFNRVSGQIG